jgi:thiol-disulfide isomerase/thioredoxin
VRTLARSLVLLAALALSGCAASVPVHPLVGKPAPEITADPITGEGPKTLAEARGKVVILDFWLTWCEPCKRAFPGYQGLVDRYPHDLVVLGVSADDGALVHKVTLVQFARETGVRFSVLWNTDPDLAKTFGLVALPSTLVIDRSGVVRYVQVGGTKGGDVTWIAARVGKLVRERTGAPSEP